MPGKNEVALGFREIAGTPTDVHDATVGLMSYLYRPVSTRTNRFDGPRQSLHRFTVLVHRPQWKLHRGTAVPANVVAVYAFRHDRRTGRVSVDAQADPECNPTVWDAAIPRRMNLPHTLVPGANRTGARASIVLHRAVVGTVLHGHPAADSPTLPAFLAVFPDDRQPVMERTSGLLDAVRTLHPRFAGAADAEVPDDLCRSVFASLVHREGRLIYAPHWLFSREPGDHYPVHPGCGGPRPSVTAPDGTEVDGWVAVEEDGWVPKAQEPIEVVADLSRVLGRRSLAAWEVLVEAGCLPADVPHAEWAATCPDAEWEEFRARTLAGFLGGDVFGRESEVGVVDLVGQPNPESMSFRRYGLDVDFFSVRPKWSFELRPLSRRDVGRARAGQPIGGRRSRRARQHARRI
jgi:hypothetical protein